MDSTLVRIKRAVLRGRMRFTEKALVEMYGDTLSREEVAESILNASAIYKTMRAAPRGTLKRTDYLHVIRARSLDGILIYSKGKLDGPPICSSPRIRKVRRTFQRVGGPGARPIVVTCYECPQCGERIYEPEVADRILAGTGKRATG